MLRANEFSAGTAFEQIEQLSLLLEDLSHWSFYNSEVGLNTERYRSGGKRPIFFRAAVVAPFVERWQRINPVFAFLHNFQDEK